MLVWASGGYGWLKSEWPLYSFALVSSTVKQLKPAIQALIPLSIATRSSMKLRTSFAGAEIQVKKQRKRSQEDMIDWRLNMKDPAFLSLPSSHDENLVRNVAELCDVSPDRIQDVLPCSPMQAGLMSLASKTSAGYVMRAVLSVSPSASLERLRRAWQDTVQAMPILCTRIVQVAESGLVQVVLEDEFLWSDDVAQGEVTKIDSPTPMGLGQPLCHFVVDRRCPDHGAQQQEIRLIWNIHHAIYDGWLLSHITKTVMAKYGMTGNAVAPTLVEPDSTAAYIEYVRALQSQSGQKAASEYWRERLASFEGAAFPAITTGLVGSKDEGVNTADCWTDILLECRGAPRSRWSPGVRTSTLVYAAWAATQMAFTNSGDVIFGTTMSGRGKSPRAVEGPLLVTVPIRISASAGRDEATTVGAVLDALEAQTSASEQHGQFGLRIVEQASEDSKRACGAVNTLLVVQPTENDLVADDDQLRWETSSKDDVPQTYGLTLQVFLLGDRYRLAAHLNTRELDPWLAQRMLEHFASIVGTTLHVASRADPFHSTLTAASSSSFLSAVKMSARVGGTDTVPGLLHELVVEQCAAAGPDAVAIDAWDGQMTYREVDAASRWVAESLRDLGVRPGDRIPVCLDRSRWAVIALLAVLRAGAAFVPLDMTQSSDRRRRILEQLAPVKVLVASPRYAAACQAETEESSDIAVFTLSDEEDEEKVKKGQQEKRYQCREETPSSKHVVDPHCPAYVLFTSGSTGQPKGVIISHVAAATSCTDHGRRLGFSSATRTLQFSAFTFDACIMEVLTTLLFGGCICLPSDEERLGDLEGAIVSRHVNTAFLTPSVASLLDPANLPSLHTIAIGGEVSSRGDFERWRHLSCVAHVYGPTECTIFCIMNEWAASEPRVSREPSSAPAVVPIGKPVGCSAAWVVLPNDHRVLAPVGAPGELLIEGPTLANGYLNNPEADAAAFLPSGAWDYPGSSDEGFNEERYARVYGRLYRTGDIVSYDAHGQLVYHERKDRQIKIRGQRVELGEVEHHVKIVLSGAHQVVAEVVSGDVLVVFVSFSGGSQKDTSRRGADAIDMELLGTTRYQLTPSDEARLAECLPRYMVPSLFIEVNAMLPRLSSGKIDRKQLNQLAASHLSPLSNLPSSDPENGQAGDVIDNAKLARSIEMPVTAMEKRLHSIWAQVLSLSPATFGIDESFLRLGGDSISAMQVSSMLRRGDMPSIVPVETILAKKTIRTIAAASQPLFQGHHQQKHQRQSGDEIDRQNDAAIAADDENGRDKKLLSPMQNLWLTLCPSLEGCFDQGFFLRVRDPSLTSLKAVQNALSHIISRHAVFHTRLSRDSNTSRDWLLNEAVDEESRSASLAIRYVRGSSHSVAAAISELRETISVITGPTVVAALCEQQSNDEEKQETVMETFLFVSAHHLIIDLVSWRVVLEEIEMILNAGAHLAGDLSLPFYEWTKIQVSYAAAHLPQPLPSPSPPQPDSVLLEYWGVLDPAAQITVGRSSTHVIEIGPATTQALLGTANEAFDTEFSDLMVTALLHSFAHVFLDRRLPVVHVEGHGRQVAALAPGVDTSVDISRTVGWFTTAHPVYVADAEAMNIFQLVRSTKDAMRRMNSLKGWEYFTSKFARHDRNSMKGRKVGRV